MKLFEDSCESSQMSTSIINTTHVQVHVYLHYSQIVDAYIADSTG